MTAQAAEQAVVDAVGQVMFGSESRFENLSVVPLLRAQECDADYVTLDEALARGWAQISEVNDAGQVSALKVVVSGTVPVLLLDGEELIGAKQNRVVNLTIMTPPQCTTVIPVSCVESGRWRHVSRGFSSAPRAQYAEGRAAKMRQVTASLRSGSRASDQGEVWSLIAEKSARLNATSETAAMSAMYEKLETSIEEFVTAFSPIDHQVGAMFFINGAQAGLELFDAASTWRKLAPKLVRSYAVDAIDRRGRTGSPRGRHEPKAFATAVGSTPALVFPAIGGGSDVRLTGTVVAGAALVAAGRVIHLSAFPIDQTA